METIIKKMIKVEAIEEKEFFSNEKNLTMLKLKEDYIKEVEKELNEKYPKWDDIPF